MMDPPNERPFYSSAPPSVPPGAPADPWGARAPAPVRATPAVWPWFIVFCVAMALIYLMVAGIGLIFFVVPAAELEMEQVEATLMGSVYLGMGLVLTLPYAIAPFLPKRKWVWGFDIVLICLGLTSCCTMPACIPMLIFWLKPETKAFFGWV